MSPSQCCTASLSLITTTSSSKNHLFSNATPMFDAMWAATLAVFSTATGSVDKGAKSDTEEIIMWKQNLKSRHWKFVSIDSSWYMW